MAEIIEATETLNGKFRTVYKVPVDLGFREFGSRDEAAKFANVPVSKKYTRNELMELTKMQQLEMLKSKGITKIPMMERKDRHVIESAMIGNQRSGK